jgi:hypothetical protein
MATSRKGLSPMESANSEASEEVMSTILWFSKTAILSEMVSNFVFEH